MPIDQVASCEKALNDIWRVVRDFHLAFGLPTTEPPQLLATPRTGERSKWMREELHEFESAATIPEQADAMVDLIYLAIGTLVEMGVPPGRVFELVHSSNLGKRWADGTVRLDREGKVLKPPAWSSPNVEIEAYVRQLSGGTATSGHML